MNETNEYYLSRIQWTIPHPFGSTVALSIDVCVFRAAETIYRIYLKSIRVFLVMNEGQNSNLMMDACI